MTGTTSSPEILELAKTLDVPTDRLEFEPAKAAELVSRVSDRYLADVSAFAMDDLSRLDAVGDLLTDAQLDSIVAARFAAAPDAIRARYDAAVAGGELTAAEPDRLRAS